MKHNLKSSVRFLILVSLVAALSGCGDTTTLGNSGRPVQQTAVQKAISKCVLTVGGGALLGALIGDSKKSAVGGALIGAGACAVFLEVASREDQARLAAAELAALKASRSNSRSFKTKSGKKATVRTKVKSAPVPQKTAQAGKITASVASKTSSAPSYTACRYAQQTISVEGKTSSAPQQLWCRVSTGDWQAVKA